MGKKSRRQEKKDLTTAERLVTDWAEGNEFKSYLGFVVRNYAASIMSISYNVSEGGIAQSAAILLPDKSKARVTKFIAHTGHVRLSISTAKS